MIIIFATPGIFINLSIQVFSLYRDNKSSIIVRKLFVKNSFVQTVYCRWWKSFKLLLFYYLFHMFLKSLDC